VARSSTLVRRADAERMREAESVDAYGHTDHEIFKPAVMLSELPPEDGLNFL